MRWMTKKQIKSAAAKGPLPAVDNALAKYQQMLDAPEDELRKKLIKTNKDDKVKYISSSYCACCYNAGWGPYFRNRASCSNCIIGTKCGDRCTNTGWSDVNKCAGDFVDGGPVAPLRRAIRVLIRNIKKARKAYIKEQSK